MKDHQTHEGVWMKLAALTAACLLAGAAQAQLGDALKGAAKDAAVAEGQAATDGAKGTAKDAAGSAAGAAADTAGGAAGAATGGGTVSGAAKVGAGTAVDGPRAAPT